jgi:hypothetical protein
VAGSSACANRSGSTRTRSTRRCALLTAVAAGCGLSKIQREIGTSLWIPSQGRPASTRTDEGDYTVALRQQPGRAVTHDAAGGSRELGKAGAPGTNPPPPHKPLDCGLILSGSLHQAYVRHRPRRRLETPRRRPAPAPSTQRFPEPSAACGELRAPGDAPGAGRECQGSRGGLRRCQL